jgi:hypothetical protein
MRTAVLALFLIASARAQSAKQLRPGEFELYDEAIKDINAAAFPKAIAAIELWTQKFPETDYANDRAALATQAFAGSNQPVKAIDAAIPLLAKDPKTLFAGDAAQGMTIRLLYNATWAISHLPNPNPDERAAGEKAARELMQYDKPLPGVTDAQWTEARADMKEKATAALLYISMLPGIQAMAKQPPDCAAAESAYAAALNLYPDRSTISYELGRALSCEAKTNPDKFIPAIWHFQRAAVIDPTLGDPRNDPAKIRTYADNAYIRFHGSNEGLDQLKQQVKTAPLPPPDFKILTATEIANIKQHDFETNNPQLALWQKIKARLLEDDGTQYFESDMKGAALPELKGMLLEAKPACRPRELIIAVSESTPEVTLKLDKPLAGKPQLHAELQWQGEPEAFTRSPFMLTVKTDAVPGLAVEKCITPAPVRKR